MAQSDLPPQQRMYPWQSELLSAIAETDREKQRERIAAVEDTIRARFEEIRHDHSLHVERTALEVALRTIRGFRQE
jgi:hypothetical protein